jgi:hypothetical protein
MNQNDALRRVYHSCFVILRYLRCPILYDFFGKFMPFGDVIGINAVGGNRIAGSYIVVLAKDWQVEG